MIPFTQCSEKGKLLRKKSDQWWPATAKGSEGIFWSDRPVLYFNQGGDYKTVKNSLKHTL